jgi:hypothetical protein
MHRSLNTTVFTKGATLGARKNKYAILGIGPRWQGDKTPEYMDIPSSRTSSRTGCIGVQKVTLFHGEPLPNAQPLLLKIILIT